MSTVADILTATLILTGALLALVAALGLHRLGDTLSRMHAATKPATLGVLCCAVGASLQVGDVSDVTKLIVVVVLQLVTAPVGAHMLARSIMRRDEA
jgi:multicomponent Na+:H+ antiporter subunit G